MSSKKMTAIFLLVMIAVLSPAGKGIAGSFYLGAHLGKVMLTQGAKESLNEDHYSGGILAGKDILETEEIVLAVEGDLALPVSKGTSEYFHEWKLTTVGLFGCARLGKKGVYLKLKFGLIYQDLEVEASRSPSYDDLGLSLGIGGGFRLAERVFLEIEGIVFDQDLGYLRAGAGYHF